MPRLITGVKTDAQLQAMRDGGRRLAEVYEYLRGYVKPGVTTGQINDVVHKLILEKGATPTYLEPVPDFPGVICISVNDAVVHGVPTDYVLQKGDVVGFDLVITYKDMKTDSAFTMVVGEEPSGDKKKLLEVTEASLQAGIDAIYGDGTTTGEIGAAIGAVLEKAGLGVIRDLVGHGVGLEMHMAPDVPNFDMGDRGVVLREGDTIAIEPMATLGGESVYIDRGDGWTIYTQDASLAAHFEHTVLITRDGAEVLTRL